MPPIAVLDDVLDVTTVSHEARACALTTRSM